MKHLLCLLPNYHQHKAEVIAFTSIEEIEAYDITKDYPEKLVINI